MCVPASGLIVVLFGQSSGSDGEAPISHVKNYLLKVVGSLGESEQCRTSRK